MRQFVARSILIPFVLATFFSPMYVYAKSTKQAKKDEVVYAILADDGSIDDIYVVNSFDVQKDQTITDYGDYTAVKNLTDLSPIKQINDQIKLTAEKGKFHYEGQLATTDLPWKLAIHYYLNGEEVSTDQLGGANGDIKIAIDIKQNKNVPAVFFEHYVLQISLNFPMEQTDQIVAEKGTIANAGENKQVTFTVMPGEEEQLTTTLVSDQFTMEGIEIAAVPASFDFDMPDVSDFEKEMRKLAKAIAAINHGTADLTDGIAELRGGADDLTAGSKQFQNGLNEATDEIISATKEMEETFQEVEDITGLLADIDFEQFKQYLEEIDTLSESFEQLIESLKQLKANMTIANDTVNEWKEILPDHVIAKEDLEALYETDANPDVLDQLIESYEASQLIRQQLDEIDGDSLFSTEAVDQIILELEASQSMVDEFSDTLTILSDGTTIEGSVDEMLAMFNTFETGITELQTGMQQLASSYSAIHEGISGLASGAKQLENGSHALHDGTNELADATKNLPGEMSDEMEALMDAYDFSDFDLVSFVSEKNNSIRSVQFVMKTNKVEKKEEKPSDKKQPEKKSFWQKFLDLFR